MAKNDIPSYDATAANNTDVQSVDISENCSPAGINNAIREVMADLKNVDTGAVALTSPSASQLTIDQGSGGQGISLQRSSYDTMDIELSESGFRIRNETDGRTDLFIDGGGAVGISTASPSTTLHAKGATASGVIRAEHNSSGVYAEITGSSSNAYLATGNNPLIFEVNSAERMRILSTGGLTFNGDTAAANALDDYEEGTFTPTVSGSSSAGSGSFSAQSGTYTKVGNRVFGSCFITHSNTHTGSGAYQVSLPFTSSANSGGAIVSYKFGWANNGPDFADVFQALMYVRFDGNTTATDLPFSNTQNTAQMRLVFSFETA